MKYFTEAWHSGELDDETFDAVVEDYQQHLASLLPYLPPDVQMLATDVSLHDGLLLKVVADTEQATLLLTLRCGDLQVGYFDLELHYFQAIFTQEEVERLAQSVANPSSELESNMRHRSEALYDELDIEGELFVHRILFVSLHGYHELTTQFKHLHLRTTPRKGYQDPDV